MAKKVNKPILTEAQEQCLLFEWAALKKIDTMFAIPNGGSRHILEAVNLKKQGVKKGIPDIFLATPTINYHGLFIEMKRTKGGVVSPEQKEWIAKLEKNGYCCIVCKGFEEAKDGILHYFK